MWPFSRRPDPVEAARQQFNACFGHFDPIISQAKADHGRVNDAIKAKRDAVHAALAGATAQEMHP